MITNQREQKICDRYSTRGKDGKVRCCVCPLRKGEGDYDSRCKANSHYNRQAREWEYDVGGEE